MGLRRREWIRVKKPDGSFTFSVYKRTAEYRCQFVDQKGNAHIADTADEDMVGTLGDKGHPYLFQGAVDALIASSFQ